MAAVVVVPPTLPEPVALAAVVMERPQRKALALAAADKISEAVEAVPLADMDLAAAVLA